MSRRRARLAVAIASVLALGVTACGPASPAARLARTPRDAAGPNATQLVFYPCSRHGELLAPVDVEGHPTWLLVDTGAYRHVLVPSFVTAAGLQRWSNSVRVGHGRGLRATVLKLTTMSMPGIGALPRTQMLSFDVIGLADCGAGGVLAPGRLASAGAAAVLDLPGARLALAAPEAALADLAARPGAAFEAALISDHAYVVESTIDEHPARLLVDTGACCTWVYRDSAVGRALASRAEIVARGPSDIQDVAATHRLHLARVRAGDLARPLDVYLVPGTPGETEPEGALGVDALRSCLIVIWNGALRARCSATPRP